MTKTAKKQKKSRIFCSSLGHNAEEFKIPEVIEIMKRGIMWAVRDRIIPEYNQ